jgi:uncharacterized protein YlzI (FlbEa/FlbD family)
MKYLKKVFFLNSVKGMQKKELHICSDFINFFTWYKTDSEEGTMLHCPNEKISTNPIIDGMPENVNQIIFDGEFFKSTAHYLSDNGGMKKFSAWINPDNIVSMYNSQPDDCQICFLSGERILIANKLSDVLKSLYEHNKKIKERRKLKYGK